jgi:hypothetical protein
VKSWLQSQTIRNAILSFTILVAGVTTDAIKSKELKQEHLYTLCGGAYALLKTVEGRAKANTPIYTPGFLPGPNKPPSEDINDKLACMAQAASDFERSQTLEKEIANIDIPDTAEESRSNGEVTELEIVGLRELGRKYKLTFIHDSKIKDSLDDSATLAKESILEVSKGEVLEIHFYKRDVANHIKVQFTEGGLEYFAYIPHLELTNSKGEKVSLVDNVVVKAAPASVVAVKKNPITLPTGEVVDLDDPVIPKGHISFREFTHDGSRPLQTADHVFNAREVCKVAEKVRDHFKTPITVNSGFRPAHINNQVGGSTLSAHVQAAALDIVLAGVSPREVYNFLDPLHEGGLASSTIFTHIDVCGLEKTRRSTASASNNYYQYKSWRRWDYGF